jgi:hypothetical protein
MTEIHGVPTDHQRCYRDFGTRRGYLINHSGLPGWRRRRSGGVGWRDAQAKESQRNLTRRVDDRLLTDGTALARLRSAGCRP